MPYLVPDKIVEPLYAIVPYFNPWRWKSREKHTLRALKHFHDSGAVIVLVEAAFNRREFTFKDSGLDGTASSCSVLGSDPRFRHRYIALRTTDELWLKENLINAGVAMALPYDWQQVCWLDSDVHFVRPNWVGECIHKLQHYKFIQMFSHARDLAPNYELLAQDYPHADGLSWMQAHHDNSLATILKGDASYPYASGKVFPGLAWACTRRAWDEVGGLIDFAVWGGADWHMAHALIEQPDSMMRKDLHPNYKQMVNAWLEKCRRHIRRNVGVMEGSIFHSWHGRKLARGYNAKHALLARIGFDPLRHLKRDYQGLYQLHDDGSDAYVQLRDTMRLIAKERNEDSIDTDIGMTQGH